MLFSKVSVGDALTPFPHLRFSTSHCSFNIVKFITLTLMSIFGISFNKNTHLQI